MKLADQLDRAAALCERIHPGCDCGRILRRNAADQRARNLLEQPK
jgi:hypothetical protein